MIGQIIVTGQGRRQPGRQRSSNRPRQSHLRGHRRITAHIEGIGCDGCDATPRAVVPAQAGTHTPCRRDVAPSCKLSPSGVMGPRLRGDDGADRDVLSVALLTVLTLAAPSASAADRIRWRCSRPARWPGSSTSSRPTASTRRPVSIETIELASTEAGKIALKGGSADLMLSDWLWVARERSLGDALVFYPSSSTLGAVMVPAQSPIRTIADLKGKKLAVAGGPLDKSWLLLQAFARRSGLDLRKQATHRLRRAAAAVAEGAAGRDRRHADVLEFLRGA